MLRHPEESASVLITGTRSYVSLLFNKPGLLASPAFRVADPLSFHKGPLPRLVSYDLTASIVGW